LDVGKGRRERGHPYEKRKKNCACDQKGENSTALVLEEKIEEPGEIC